MFNYMKKGARAGTNNDEVIVVTRVHSLETV